MAEPNDNPLRRPEAADELRGNLAGGPPPAVRVTEGGIREVGFDDPDLIIPSDKLLYHVPHPDAHPERHEHSDVPIRPLAVALAAIAGIVLFSFVFLAWLFWRYERQQESLEKPRTGVTVAGQSVVRPVVPEPRLQGVPGLSESLPAHDMERLRQDYARQLNSYGKSGEDGYAQISIDRAMDLALELNLFPTTQGTASKGDQK
jgi:hypothetical protein